MNRIKYIDMLKFVAIFSIVIVHVSGIWANVELLNLPFHDLKECLRFGVPIFLMITGCLAFNKEIELSSFLKKKVVRIALPVIFFTILGILLSAYSTEQPLSRYWYCWMALGVYLAIPLVNVFIKNVKSKELDYFIIIFLIASILYHLTWKMGVDIALDLNFFIGPMSYVILGYYLSRKEFNLSANKIILISLIVFIGVSVFKILHYETLYLYDNLMLTSKLSLSFPQIIQAASVFLMIKYTYEAKSGIFGSIRGFLEKDIVNKFIVSISVASYGIYLVHLIILRGWMESALKNIHLTGTMTAILILLASTALLLVSGIIITILGKIPYVKLVSGYA
ncbi:acyltransferase [uncultured Methanobrevibacter sp.]|uniref:acyltransferase n=1 Tax=uncultured Methanobrevibacter sp. TaxID=253161 RepID=UPI0025D62555|nr:acyltransferase [uncultured Methanobrevibacter sp.]